MKNYNWDIRSHRFTIKYLKEKIGEGTSGEDLFSLEKSLEVYSKLIDIIEPKKKLGLIKIVDWIKGKNVILTRERVSLSKNSMIDSSTVNKACVSENLINELMNSAKDVAGIKVPQEKILTNFKLENEDLVELAKDFFKKLEMPYISDKALKFLESKDNEICITSDKNIKTENQFLYDYVFGKAYVIVNKKNTIEDLVSLVRQTMNVVYFHSKKYTKNNMNYDLSESVIHMVDYLLIDYLENNGIKNGELEELKNKKLLELQIQGQQSIYKITTRLATRRGIGASINYDIQDVMEDISEDEIRELLKVKAHLMGIILAEASYVLKDYAYVSIIKLLEGRASLTNEYDFKDINIDDKRINNVTKKIKKVNKVG